MPARRRAGADELAKSSLNAERLPGIARLGHLAGRFATSLSRRRVRPEDRAWVATLLLPQELRLWDAMPGIDQVESVAVARRARTLLADGVAAESPVDGWLAAALLHDVGKTEAGLGPLGRSVATVVGSFVTNPARGTGAGPPNGWRRRVGTYLVHGPVGADRIAAAGGRAEVAAWARHHHDPRAWNDPGFAARIGVPLAIAWALARADGEAVGRSNRPRPGESE